MIRFVTNIDPAPLDGYPPVSGHEPILDRLHSELLGPIVEAAVLAAVRNMTFANRRAQEIARCEQPQLLLACLDHADRFSPATALLSRALHAVAHELGMIDAPGSMAVKLVARCLDAKWSEYRPAWSAFVLDSAIALVSTHRRLRDGGSGAGEQFAKAILERIERTIALSECTFPYVDGHEIEEREGR